MEVSSAIQITRFFSLISNLIKKNSTQISLNYSGYEERNPSNVTESYIYGRLSSHYILTNEEESAIAEKTKCTFDDLLRLYIHSISKLVMDSCTLDTLLTKVCSFGSFINSSSVQGNILEHTLDNPISICLAFEVYKITFQAYQYKLITPNQWFKYSPLFRFQIRGYAENLFNQSIDEKNFVSNEDERINIEGYYALLGRFFEGWRPSLPVDKPKADKFILGNMMIEDSVPFCDTSTGHEYQLNIEFYEHGMHEYRVNDLHISDDSDDEASTVSLMLPSFHDEIHNISLVLMPDFYEFFFPGLRVHYEHSVNSFHADAGFFYESVPFRDTSTRDRRLYTAQESDALARCYYRHEKSNGTEEVVQFSDYQPFIATSVQSERAVSRSTFNLMWSEIQKMIMICCDPRLSEQTLMHRHAIKTKRNLANQPYSPKEYSDFCNKSLELVKETFEQQTAVFMVNFTRRLEKWSQVSPEEIMALKNHIIDLRTPLARTTIDNEPGRPLIKYCTLGFMIGTLIKNCNETMWQRLSFFAIKYLSYNDCINSFASSFPESNRTMASVYSDDTVSLSLEDSRKTFHQYYREKFIQLCGGPISKAVNDGMVLRFASYYDPSCFKSPNFFNVLNPGDQSFRTGPPCINPSILSSSQNLLLLAASSNDIAPHEKQRSSDAAPNRPGSSSISVKG